MSSKRKAYTHKVTQKGSLVSEHTSAALAHKRIARIVAMSHGRMTPSQFRVEPIGTRK